MLVDAHAWDCAPDPAAVPAVLDTLGYRPLPLVADLSRTGAPVYGDSSDLRYPLVRWHVGLVVRALRLLLAKLADADVPKPRVFVVYAAQLGGESLGAFYVTKASGKYGDTIVINARSCAVPLTVGPTPSGNPSRAFLRRWMLRILGKLALLLRHELAHAQLDDSTMRYRDAPESSHHDATFYATENGAIRAATFDAYMAVRDAALAHAERTETEIRQATAHFRAAYPNQGAIFFARE
jgi:hypothetical protein